jgi:hypothetical protein
MLERWEILAGTPRELGLELEDQGGAADAVGALLRAGLIHRDGDGFLFAKRQAIRFSRLHWRLSHGKQEVCGQRCSG